jgi:gluconate 2-dehydrogenase gamma chain
MADPNLSRRRFLRNAAFAGGGVYLVEWGWACKSEPHPAAPAPAPAPVAVTPQTSSHQTFTDAEFITLTAAIDRLLPKDADPGGVEAGVPSYFDRAFTNPDLRRMRDDFIAGLAALDRASQRDHQLPFSKATAEAQDALLRRFASMPPASGEAHFYETLITFALEGFLGDPVYGGNQQRCGWALVGFDPGPPMPDHASMVMPKSGG